MKQLFFLLALFSLIIFVHASTITDFSVTPIVKLGEIVVATGFISGDNNVGQLCSAYIFDLNNGNTPLPRLSDEYSNSLGRFWFEQKFTEPPFYRGNDYNFVVDCQGTSASGVFRTDQPRSMDQPTIAWLLYFKDNANFIVLGVVAVFVLMGFIFLFSKFIPH
jgi:hypothetical protein